jgi:hypothetical protein
MRRFLTVPSLGLALLLAAPATAPAGSWRVCVHPDGVIVVDPRGAEIASGAFRVNGSARRCAAVFAIAREVSTVWARSRGDALPRSARIAGRVLPCRYRAHAGGLRVLCGGDYRFDMSRRE